MKRSAVEAASRRVRAAPTAGTPLPLAKSNWRERAARLADRVPLARWHPAALAGAPHGRWAVAFSGGPDSLALLLLLYGHFPGRRESLVAFHFDHRMRGRQSAADAAFCARVCAGLGVPLVTARWRRPQGTAPTEAAARAARNDFLEKACRRRRVAALWLGHQADDIAETFFMRLARGSGTGGLAAPRPRSVGAAGGVIRLRPLLPFPKRALEAILAAEGIPFRTDATNSGDRFFRNRVRRQLVGRWTKLAEEGRDALAGAVLSRDLLEEDDTALEAWADRCRALTPSGRLNLARLRGIPRAVARRVLHRWIDAQRAATQKSLPAQFRLSRAGFEQLLSAAMTSAPGRFSLGRDHFACIRGPWLFRTGG